MELYCHRQKTRPKTIKDERPKIILLHGMGGTGAIWRPIVASLEDHYTLLAPDQRCHGRSLLTSSRELASDSTFGPLSFGQDLVDTLALLHFYPAWVVGHSMGVRSACAFAQLKPAWVKGLILIDLSLTGGREIPESREANLKLLNFIKELPIEFQSKSEARDYLLKHAPDPSFAQYLIASSLKTEETKKQFCTTRFSFHPLDLVKIIQEAQKAPLLEWVKSSADINKPVLILRGSESTVYSQADFQSEKTSLMSYPLICFKEIKGAGHGLPFEKKAEFLGTLIQWIEKNSHSF
jgi:pimeloyl-ACP methyl ester carboxylesterase